MEDKEKKEWLEWVKKTVIINTESEKIARGAMVICPACGKQFKYSIYNRTIHSNLFVLKNIVHVREVWIALKCPHCKTIILPET